MPKSISVKPKKTDAAEPKKRGRPATGKDPLVGVRIPVELTAEIDAWAKQNGVSRSEAIRRMIEHVLNGERSRKRDGS
jgi:hypothetical protein